MKNLVVVSLILVLVVVIGVTIRGTIFRHYIPEGFENANGNENANETANGNGNETADGSGNGNANGNANENANENGNGNENGNANAVQVDTKSGVKNFMSEYSGNSSMMNNITHDTQSMIKNQRELMEMLKNVQPALNQGMEFMKAFKGMMGGN